MVKGFKVFNADWSCRDFHYRVGQTYKTDKEIALCSYGFHFCLEAKSCFSYYSFDPDYKVAEVIAYNRVIHGDDKSVTNEIEIVREIPWLELLTLVNKGRGNTGFSNDGKSNSGDHNPGHYNTGDYNSGNNNVGKRNEGNNNVGNYNPGRHNTGHRNNGNHNTGDRNSGDQNVGDSNFGNSNVGDGNFGHSNVGDGNWGDYNVGDFNRCSYSLGCFCTEGNNSDTIKMFDLDSNMSLYEWRESRAYSLLNRLFGLNNGQQQPWYWNLSGGDKQVILSLPNFDAEKFKRTTTIDVHLRKPEERPLLVVEVNQEPKTTKWGDVWA